MNLSEQLKAVVELLQASNVRYALAGGLVASLYRQTVRMTADVDFLIFSGAHSEAQAKKILKARGLEISEVRKAQLEGGPQHAIKSRSTPILLIAGRPIESGTSVGVDFLLPGFPWFQIALERAEENYVDFGFGKIPCLTAEDIVLSKLYSISNRSDRFQDFDDIQDIFLADRKLDLNYLSSKMRELRLKIPSQLKNCVPDILRKTSRSLSL
jgi:Nucleotidyl transferase AbiEii toxin, Type IV TA system